MKRHFTGGGPPSTWMIVCSCFANKSEDGADGRDVDRQEPNESIELLDVFVNVLSPERL